MAKATKFIEFIIVDYKDGHEIIEEFLKLQQKRKKQLYEIEVESEGDDLVYVVSDEKLTKKQAQKEFENYENEQFGYEE